MRSGVSREVISDWVGNFGKSRFTEPPESRQHFDAIASGQTRQNRAVFV